MAKVKFYLRPIKGTDLNNIFLRIYSGRINEKIDITINTHLKINPENWNQRSQSIKQKASFENKLNLQKRLNEILKKSESIILDCQLNNTPISKELFYPAIDEKYIIKNTDTVLIESMKRKRESYMNVPGRDYQNTIKNYQNTINRLILFEPKYLKQLYKNTNPEHRLHFTDIDLKFHTAYLKYCDTDLGLSKNTIGKDIKNIRAVCIEGKTNGHTTNPQCLSKKFYAPSEKSVFTVLSIDELKLINEFKGANYLENARDWLIIGCWTGCRIKDLVNLSPQNIILEPNKSFIRLTQSKTKETVNIPIHPDVVDIYNKLGGFPRKISDVNFNIYIKELCKQVGINQIVYGTKRDSLTNRKVTGYFPKYELIRSHTCRRSFATNHYGKIPTVSIMAVTGHKAERQFLDYIGQQENDHLNDFIELWSKK